MPTAPARARARVNTFKKTRRVRFELPAGKHERRARGLAIPAAHPEPCPTLEIGDAGNWWILSDVHAPYHDRLTIRLGAREAKRRNVRGILLNGDILDFHDLSDHDKDPGAARYVDEIETGREFLRWLREQFPKARIVYREGNHEERLPRYVMKNAPALFGLDCLTTPELVELRNVGGEWLGDRRLITLGKLPILHGHEFRGGGGKFPAKWLFDRTHYSAMCGHFHRGSEYGTRDILERERRVWTLGCACSLKPRYMRYNEWNNGCAFVDLSADGTFGVDNMRVNGGKLV